MKTKKRIKKNKNNKTKKNFEYTKCGPLSGDKLYTCYNSNQLIKLRNIWNTRRPDKIIKETDSRTIWNKLRDNLKNSCNQESCWLRQNIFKYIVDKSMLNVFSPLRPKKWDKNPKEWLTGEDIENVMKQYEKKYKHFEFIGPSPIDYDHKTSYQQCVWNDLCKFSLNNLMYRNKNFIGVIFNTDPHNLGGSHWISMVIDCNLKHILFFDSVGRKMPKQVNKFIQNVVKQGKERNIEFKVDELHNHNIEHQQQDTECGMYSLYFIINMLTKKKNWNYFTSTIIPDKDVEKFRNIYFNKNL